jgi:putative ABC transport system permease protein
MIKMDLFECAWRELRRRKLRTSINVIGYTLAVAIMVVLISAIVYSKQTSNAILNNTGTHFIASIPANLPACSLCSLKLSTEKDEGFVVYGVPTKLISTKFIDKVNQIPAVKSASACLLYRFKDKNGDIFTVAGFDSRNDVAVSTTCCAVTDVVSGRFLMPEENGKVMLEEAYATQKQLNIGNKITIAGSTFTVVGIINPGIRPAKADVYMHFNEAEWIINKSIKPSPINNEANVILVETKSSKLQEKAMSDMKNLLPGLIFSSYACYKPASKVMGINESAVYLLVIIIGIFTIMLSIKSQLSSVIERRRDIGILKAIGWTDGDVVLQILTESLIQALLGGIIGCLISPIILILIPVKTLIGIESPLHISISPLVLVAGLLLAIFGGIIAGIFPSFVASHQRPADSLRSI